MSQRDLVGAPQITWSNSKKLLLLVQVFIASTCSLTYELLLGTGAANITGNSISSFSISIGLFLAGLGVGAFVSRWVKDTVLADTFVSVETILALVGGGAVIMMYLSLIFTPFFTLVQVLLTLGVGLLSGLEIPILTRLINQQEVQAESSDRLRSVLANVLSFDYLGGLAASLLFPVLLVPYFGLVRLSFLVGTVNVLIAFLGVYLFWKYLRYRWMHLILISLVGVSLLAAAIWSGPIYNFTESNLYRDPIIYSTQTQYQRLVITQRGPDTRLYINGGIQFSTLDEYRYHESLVMPALASLASTKTNLKVVVLGGGDGLVAREVLKFEPWLQQLDLVDIDPDMTGLARKMPTLVNLNQSSLLHPKVRIHNVDAWQWIQEQPLEQYDLVIGDLPDPDDIPLARLYSREFFTFVDRVMQPTGLFVTQSSSPLGTPKVFWSINRTLQSIFQSVQPYHQYVPSFGMWGFNIAAKQPTWKISPLSPIVEQKITSNRHIVPAILPNIFNLDEDVLKPRLRNGELVLMGNIRTNSIDNLILVNYYQEIGLEFN